MRNPTKEALLAKLRTLGLPLCDDPQIWGRNPWRVVDAVGRDNTPPIFSMLSITEAATTASLTASLGPDGYEVSKLTALTG